MPRERDIKGRERETDTRHASLQLRLDSERGVPWAYASLMHKPEVDLYNGEFPEPFTDLLYRAQHAQDQLLLTAAFGTGTEFNSRYQNTIGSPEDLAPFLKHYPQHEFRNGDALLVVYKDGKVHGVIARTTEKQVIIQQGGQAGPLVLSPNAPGSINNLSIYLDSFNLLAQRYISAIWKASPETDQKRLQLILAVPALPEGTPITYFSTFEIVAGKYRGRPRPLDLKEDIGGYPKIKEAILGLFRDFTNPELSRQLGTHPYSNRFLGLTGKEGTGKSLFAKALDNMLRGHFGEKFEHYRLPLADMFQQHGAYTAYIVTTILNHIRENEKRGIPTLLHLDNLETLIPPHQRPKANGIASMSNVRVLSNVEFDWYMKTADPVIDALRHFGTDLGGESHWIAVLGEGRAPRVELPEAVQRTFRRVFSLQPTVSDLADVLRVQIRYTRGFAGKTGHEPFVPEIESMIDKIAPEAQGLVGRDIQQALLNITTRHKAEYKEGEDLPLITAEQISKELNSIRMANSPEEKIKPPLGFQLG